MVQWIDISQSLHADVAAWPGDAPFQRSWTLQKSGGDAVNCSSIHMSAHLGTHADAPYHVDPNGATSSQWSLDTFLGPAEVVELPSDTDAIRPVHLVGSLSQAPASKFAAGRSQMGPNWTKLDKSG